MRKGDIVEVEAIVKTQLSTISGEIIHEPRGQIYAGERRKLLARHKIELWQGMVIGYSFRQTGWVDYREYVPNIRADKYHKVWLVIPLSSDRYVKPVACLEEDLVIIDTMAQKLKEAE